MANTDPTTDIHATERADLLDALHWHRGFFTKTCAGITDEQANQRTTVSELTLGGLVKHVTAMEKQWTEFIVDGAARFDWQDIDWDNPPEEMLAEFNQGFALGDQTLADALAAFAEQASVTDELIGTVDLDADRPLPPAPWFEDGKRQTHRRTLLHILAEMVQHSGHADIIRESLDGQKTMG